MTPPVIVQANDVADGAETLAVLPVELASTEAGAVIVAVIGGLTTSVRVAVALQPPASVTVTE